MEVKYGEYLFSDDKALLDFHAICGFLSRSGWASQRPVEAIRISIDCSVCFGVYHGDRQIGFARLITDDTSVYFLCEMFIDEGYRRRGLGKKLMEVITTSDRFKNFFGFLGTSNAHGLYEKFHFKTDPHHLMWRTPDQTGNQ